MRECMAPPDMKNPAVAGPWSCGDLEARVGIEPAYTALQAAA